jgi:hypothetical protein
MWVTKLRGGSDPDCLDGRTCPAVHLTDSGTLVIVGRLVTEPEALSQMAIGDGETAIEVPASLLPEVRA